MGNRLVVTIKNNSKPIACAYYHWGATTNEAMRLTSLACRAYLDGRKFVRPIGWDAVMQACDMLVATGAGLDWQEPNPMKLPYSENHTKGVIYISKEMIEEVVSLCKAEVVIDIGEEYIYFDVFDEYNENDYVLTFNDKELKQIDETLYTDIYDVMHVPIINYETIRTYITKHPAGVLIDDGFNKWIYKWRTM